MRYTADMNAKQTIELYKRRLMRLNKVDLMDVAWQARNEFNRTYSPDGNWAKHDIVKYIVEYTIDDRLLDFFHKVVDHIGTKRKPAAKKKAKKRLNRYVVVLKRTVVESYVTEVQARSEDEAQELAEDATDEDPDAWEFEDMNDMHVESVTKV